MIDAVSERSEEGEGGEGVRSRRSPAAAECAGDGRRDSSWLCAQTQQQRGSSSILLAGLGEDARCQTGSPDPVSLLCPAAFERTSANGKAGENKTKKEDTQKAFELRILKKVIEAGHFSPLRLVCFLGGFIVRTSRAGICSPQRSARRIWSMDFYTSLGIKLRRF